jgi:hypothetical protein
MKTPCEILFKRHHPAESKLDQIWEETLVPKLSSWRATLRHGREGATERDPLLSDIASRLWRELILPSRRIWAGLACAWIVIAVLNIASFEPTTVVAGQKKPPSHEEMRALIEQRRMLAQLIGPLSEPPYTHKRTVPGPHSERAAQTATA